MERKEEMEINEKKEMETEEMEIYITKEVVTLTNKEFDELFAVKSVEINPHIRRRKARLAEFGRILNAEHSFARSRGIPCATFPATQPWDPENTQGKRIKGKIVKLKEYKIVG